jgi:multiple sugar transport system permease protein
MSRGQTRTAYLFLLPNLAGFGVFVVVPVLAALTLSFFRWDLFHPPRFVGLRNFVQLLGRTSEANGSSQWNDPRFWRFLGNTLFFMIGIPFNMASALALALLLNQKLRGRTLFRTIFFLPTVCMGVGLMLLWRFMFNPDAGIVNASLHAIGITGPSWLSYYWAKPTIMLMNLWVAMGGTNMILYLAGLQNIPPELYEAAHIDGAGAWGRFWQITLPALRPTTFFILITSIIAGFQGEFDSAYVMTQGGPDGATTSLSYYIFNHAFRWFNLGYASAVSVVLFIAVLSATLLNWRAWRGGGDA